MVVRRESTRERIVNAFEGFLIQRDTQVPPTANSFFQQKPITADIFEEVYGTAEQFFERYSIFQRSYNEAVDRKFTARTKDSVMPELTKRRGIMDLSMFDRETSEGLLSKFKNDVLQLGQLIRRVGLPNVQVPNANLYRTPFMFEMDMSSISHPVQLVLSSMMLNFDPEKRGVGAISITRSLMSRTNIENLWNRTRDMQSGADGGALKIFGDSEGRPKKIITFDVETTGVFEGSEVRSMAARSMTMDAQGRLVYDAAGENIADIAIRSPQLNGMNATLDGATKTLNQFIYDVETPDGVARKFIDMGDNGAEFIDEATKFLKKITEADMLAGHNIGFDVDKLIKTMMNQSAFTGNKAAQQAVDAFLTKVESGNFIVDTLAYARVYMQNQVSQLIDEVGENADASTRSKKFVSELYSKDVIATVQTGGKATYASVENIALNTNLFELMAQEEQAQQLFEKITKGSHIAETDVHLQTYISKYIQEGKLLIRGLAEREAEGQSRSWESEIGRHLRSVIYKSQAITPTTNIASVRHMHQTVNQYLQTAEGAKGVKLSLRMTDQFLDSAEKSALFGSAPSPDAKGILRANAEGQFVFNIISSTSSLEDAGTVVDTNLATNLIQRTLREATNLGAGVDVDMAVSTRGNVRLRRNIYDEAILSTDINFATQSKIIELATRQARGANQVQLAARIDDIDAIEEAIGSVYETFGRRVGATRNVLSRAKSIFTGSQLNVFERVGIRDIGLEDSESVADKFKAIGDVYSDVVDTHSRIFSTVLAESTAAFGQQAGARAILQSGLAGDALTDLTDKLAHTRHADILSEFGLSYFKSQDVIRLVDAGSATALPTSRIMVPPKLLKEMMQNIGLENSPINIGFSVVSETAEKPPRLNVVFRANEVMNREQARSAAEWLLATIQDSNKMGQILGDTAVSLSGNITDQAANAAALVGDDLSTAVENIASSIMERGIGYGYADESSSVQAINTLTKAGFISGNDVLTDASAEVIDFVGDDAFVVGPVRSGKVEKVLNIAPPDPRQQIANVNEVAKTIDRTNSAERLSKRVTSARMGDNEAGVLRSLYMSNKKNIRNAAIGAAAAGIGYYLYKRRQETEFYDETLEPQPTSPARYSNNQFSSFNSPSSGRNSDPLATAGVVGNLDRMRIGHTQMGNNRHNHLFGG